MDAGDATLHCRILECPLNSSPSLREAGSSYLAREKDAGTQDPRWLAFIASLPVEDPASRMRVLRTLESLGCAVLRDGVFLLPDKSSRLDHE